MPHAAKQRKNRFIVKKRHDTYQEHGKYPEPTVCTGCGAVYSNGRWTWNQSPVSFHSALCPSCRRSADHYPAGWVHIKGSFYSAHHDEILNLIKNTEALEKNSRPLERIMKIKNNNTHATITTTGIHVARRIGEALKRAYKGDFSFRYADGDQKIQVEWHREE